MEKRDYTNEDKMLEKFYGKKVATERLNIEGFAKPMPFDIYDGYAVCRDFRGHTYDMVYPLLKMAKECKELYEPIMEYVGGIDSIDEITVIHVLMTFSTLYKDGVEVQAAA